MKNSLVYEMHSHTFALCSPQTTSLVRKRVYAHRVFVMPNGGLIMHFLRRIFLALSRIAFFMKNPPHKPWARGCHRFAETRFHIIMSTFARVFPTRFNPYLLWQFFPSPNGTSFYSFRRFLFENFSVDYRLQKIFSHAKQQVF